MHRPARGPGRVSGPVINSSTGAGGPGRRRAREWDGFGTITCRLSAGHRGAQRGLPPPGSAAELRAAWPDLVVREAPGQPNKSRRAFLGASEAHSGPDEAGGRILPMRRADWERGVKRMLADGAIVATFRKRGPGSRRVAGGSFEHRA